jgi:tetratricopeptide (TPR) repeat protein
MVTSLVVFENGELKREPVEVTYRTVTYYFDDNVAKAVELKSPPVAEPVVKTAESVPEAVSREVEGTGILKINFAEAAKSSPEIDRIPPPLVLKRAPVEAPAPKPVPVSAAIPTTTAANELYLTGRNRFETGDVKGAVDAYLESIKLEAKSAEVFFNLAYAYLKLEKNNDAIKAFKQSIKLNAEKPETHYGLGLAAFRGRRFKEASDAFKKATILNPEMAKAHYGLSLAYQELGDQKGVLDEYRILERLDKSLAKKLAQTFPQYNFSCRRTQGCP